MTNCLSCGTNLEHTAPGDDDYQFDNALWIGFFGGYGMFTDTMRGFPSGGGYGQIKGADEEAVICHECAHALCDTVPWIKELLEPAGSHSHSSEYQVRHPDHYGWDYDRRAKRENHDQASE